MKIIVLGAGQVGISVAENLVSEDNDITLIDIDPVQLGKASDAIELRTVLGNAASPSVLKEAGAENADLLIAVTQSDQTNLCACRIGKMLFNLPTRIARLRSRDFIDYPELLNEDNFAVDYSICPEQIVTDHIQNLITFPGALQVLGFAEGSLSMFAVRAAEGGPIIRCPLSDLVQHLPNVDVRVAVIYRNGEALIPDGQTLVHPGDEVFCLCTTESISLVMAEFRRKEPPVRKIIIAGGGNIGSRLAMALDDYLDVKIIEMDRHRAELLALGLSRSLILHGNVTDEKLLDREGVDDVDMFVALTNHDEDNIMSAALAKRMGARRVLALVNRRSYADLAQVGTIDMTVSPAQVSIGTLLAHVRKGDVEAVYSLYRGTAEVLEIIAHGDKRSSKVVGRRIGDIDMPPGTILGALIREQRNDHDEVTGKQLLIAHDDIVICSQDHVIVLCTHKKQVREIEKLFQVGFSFF